MDVQVHDNTMNSCPVASFYSRTIDSFLCSSRWPPCLETQIILFYHVILINHLLCIFLCFQNLVATLETLLGISLTKLNIPALNPFHLPWEVPLIHIGGLLETVAFVWLNLMTSDDWTSGRHLIQEGPIRFSLPGVRIERQRVGLF